VVEHTEKKKFQNKTSFKSQEPGKKGRRREDSLVTWGGGKRSRTIHGSNWGKRSLETFRSRKKMELGGWIPRFKN